MMVSITSICQWLMFMSSTFLDSSSSCFLFKIQSHLSNMNFYLLYFLSSPFPPSAKLLFLITLLEWRSFHSKSICNLCNLHDLINLLLGFLLSQEYCTHMQYILSSRSHATHVSYLILKIPGHSWMKSFTTLNYTK